MRINNISVLLYYTCVYSAIHTNYVVKARHTTLIVLHPATTSLLQVACSGWLCFKYGSVQLCSVLHCTASYFTIHKDSTPMSSTTQPE